MQNVNVNNNNNNNNKLKIRQYVPPTSNTTAVGSLGSEGPSTNSPSVQDQQKAKSTERGSFKNKPKKVFTLMKLFDKEYPPRAKKGLKQNTCRKQIKAVMDTYAGMFSQHAASSNTGGARCTTELEQIAYKIWCMQKEDREASARDKKLLEAADARKIQNQKDLKRKLIWNVSRKDAETSSATMIDVEPEETSETSSMLIDEVGSQQHTGHELDNSLFSGEAVEDGSEAAMDQQFVKEQRLF